MVLISHVSLTDSIMGACVSHGQKTSPPEVIKGKSPEYSGLQLNVKAALPIDKAAAIEVRPSSLPKTGPAMTAASASAVVTIASVAVIKWSNGGHPHIGL
jgi:hypothetical protein